MRRFFYIPLFLMVLFILGVIIALFFRSSPVEILKALSSRETMYALRLSVLTSIAALLVSASVGIPTAYLLARESFPGKAIMELLLEIPLVMTPLIAGLGLLLLFGREWLGDSLERMGITVLFTPLGAVIAQIFIASPILVKSARAAFEAVDSRYEQAAATIGLSPFRTFCLVTVPMAKRGLLSGIIISWARAMGEFGATLMVAGATRFKTATLPISVFLNIGTGELESALACAWVLLLAGFLMLFALRMMGEDRTHDSLAQGVRL